LGNVGTPYADGPNPVQLYSPFGIETPSPVTRSRKVCTRLEFASPTGRFSEDVSHVTDGLKELNFLSRGIENKYSSSNLNNFNLMD